MAAIPSSVNGSSAMVVTPRDVQRSRPISRIAAAIRSRPNVGNGSQSQISLARPLGTSTAAPLGRIALPSSSPQTRSAGVFRVHR